MTDSERTMKSIHDGYKETNEMRERHARRKAAVDACLFALAALGDGNDRSIAKDRLRDLFDLEEGLLKPSDVSLW